MLITDEEITNTDFYIETYRRLYAANPDRDFYEIAEEAIRTTRESMSPIDILIEAHKNKWKYFVQNIGSKLINSNYRKLRPLDFLLEY